MSIVDFLSEDQEMEVAETVEIMEASDDIAIEEKESESFVLLEPPERKTEISSNSNEVDVHIIEFSANENDCNKYDYLHDSSNIIGKNLSAILSSETITEKRLLEILNEEGDCEGPKEALEEVDIDPDEEPSLKPEEEEKEKEEKRRNVVKVVISNNNENTNSNINANKNDNELKNNNNNTTNNSTKNDHHCRNDNDNKDNNNIMLINVKSDCNNNNNIDKGKITITINANDTNNINDNNTNNINTEIITNLKNIKIEKHLETAMKKKYVFDPDLAVNHLQEKCDLGDLLEIERRVLLQPVEVLCHSDKDGDTPLMIIVSKTLEESSKLYENIFAMQERLMNIRMCCQKPIEDFLDCCQNCGSSNEEEFWTPLSSKNNIGDSALTCAMKMEHSEMIINYLLSGISRNENDIRKVFEEESNEFFQEQVRYYPSLLRFVQIPKEGEDNYLLTYGITEPRLDEKPKTILSP